ncbi:SLC22A14 (predicted) [Pycnogonum litorale]
MTIAAVLEAVGCSILPFFLLKIGRRIPTCACFIFAGVCCFVVVAIPSVNEVLDWLRICIALFGRTCIAVAYCNMFVYSSEIYPTVVRNIGLGSGTLLAKVGAMLAPYVKELAKYTSPVVPLILHGTLALFGGVLVLLLPETKNRRLPHTIEDSENMSTLNQENIFQRLGRNLKLNTKNKERVEMNDLEITFKTV